uniref:Uncharacterized protein n=1 Tax=Anguilla anguilla TaxID=7936 RepID=A0A0E9TLW9_ANGAN
MFKTSVLTPVRRTWSCDCLLLP